MDFTDHAAAFGVTHVGHKRKRNEDRFIIRILDGGGALLGVSDGMGGEAGGDKAAEMTIQVLDAYDFGPKPQSRDMAAALHQAERRIQDFKRGKPDLKGMGATATVALAAGGKAFWAHSGDSRLYLLRGGELTQITKDHTFVQDLIEDGTLTLEQAKAHPLRNMLDQCVGCGSLDPDEGEIELEPGDRLLICSDGLNKHLPDETIREVLGRGGVRDAADELVRLALDAGGRDNITVVAWENG